MSDKGCHRTFDNAIPLLGGGELCSRRDAANYIALPKAEHDAPEWQAAIQTLMLVAEHGGPTMMARIRTMQALYSGDTTPRRRKKSARKYRLVR